jgi:hypothetical protein
VLPGISLITTLHADHLQASDDAASASASASAAPASADGDLLPRLLRHAGFWWRIAGLATGRSGDVSGEISCHKLRAVPGPVVPRDRPLQFRLEVGGVKVFVKGTGRGFL